MPDWTYAPVSSRNTAEYGVHDLGHHVRGHPRLVRLFDFFAHVRVPHEPSFTQVGPLVGGLISLRGTVQFFIPSCWRWGGADGGEYFAGYVTEEERCRWTMFVFTVVAYSFAVRIAQKRCC